jgi:hypothetical protein
VQPYPDVREAAEIGAGGHRSRRLDLNGSAMLVRSPRRDHEIAAWHSVLAAHDLPDRADGVDDRRSRRVRRECCQRLEDAAAIRLVWKRMLFTRTCSGRIGRLSRRAQLQRRRLDMVATLGRRVAHGFIRSDPLLPESMSIPRASGSAGQVAGWAVRPVGTARFLTSAFLKTTYLISRPSNPRRATSVRSQPTAVSREWKWRVSVSV